MGLINKFFRKCFVSISIKDDKYYVYYEVHTNKKFIKSDSIEVNKSTKELSKVVKKLKRSYKNIYIATFIDHSSQDIMDYVIDFANLKKDNYKTVFLDHKWGVGISKEILDETNTALEKLNFDFIISSYVLAFFEAKKIYKSNKSALVIYETEDFFTISIIKNQKFVSGNIYNFNDLEDYEKSDIIYNSCVALIEDFYKTTFDNFVENAVIVSHKSIDEDILKPLEEKLLLNVVKNEESSINKTIVEIIKVEQNLISTPKRKKSIFKSLKKVKK